MSDSSKIEELECQVAKLKEELQKAQLASIFHLAPSSICCRLHIQQCHVCDAYECCDNRSPARHQIDVMAAREKKVRLEVCLEMQQVQAMMGDLVAYCNNVDMANAGIDEIERLDKAFPFPEEPKP